jgi:hypothetical protein
MKFNNAQEFKPQTEYKSGGVSISKQVLAVDEEGEYYIARHYVSNGGGFWKEEDLSGTNCLIPFVVCWAELPKVDY